ncbi:glycerophosphoinositol permease [Friedmanniomyces endolithicus]|nr:glycerophosphoinositol permease [Friedmanniomyces endolithicus]
MDNHVGVSNEPSPEAVEQRRHSLANTEKPFWQRIWPIIGCGAGLFSDGYLNGVIGSVSTILATVYPDQYKNSAAQSNVSSITFVGTLIGGLIFGWASDHWSRKWSLVVSTFIIIFFAILCTGSYGANGSIQGLLAALTAYRFFLGIGIGGGYPAGSVACAESTGELKAGTRNRWFIMFTNVQIDFGFVVAALVPMIVVLITTEQHLHTAWRVCLGIGIIPPFISTIWLLYNFSSCSFGLLSSQLLSNLLGADSRLWVSFGWNTLLTFWYMPGCIAGSWLSDLVGPRNALRYSVQVQAIVGFIMAGCYKYLAVPQNVAGFVIVYGVFIALGELGKQAMSVRQTSSTPRYTNREDVGPGDNIGLIASKTSATAVRGKYYGIAAAFGKIGALIGSKTLILLYNKYYNAGETIKAGQVPFLISSVFCLVNAALALFLLPHIGQDRIEEEDARFKAYLEAEGYDVSRMGLASGESSERVVQVEKEAGKGLA